MKRCPTCQQTFPDTAPDVCPNDGTQLYSDAGQWQPQPPPQQGGYYPPPPGQYQAGGYQPGQYPPQGQYNPQGGYPPPLGQYPPPYGGPAPSGGNGLSKAALFTGIGAAGSFVLGFILIMLAINTFSFGLAQFAVIFIYLALVAGIAAVVLSIITLVSASKNPALNKAHGIIGLVLGCIPLVFWLIGIANWSGRGF